jgi:23S rRNA (cytosine1962-C5)-methyltransferase
MEITSTITLRKGKEGSVKRFHPWIFSGAIQAIDGKPTDGDWVRVVDSNSRQLAIGHYQKGTIAVRVLSFTSEPGDPKLFDRKIFAAFKLRIDAGVISQDTNAFRLVHGEGDGMPGLILDFYNGVVVMQAHSIGMHRDRYRIAEALQHVMGLQVNSIYYKSQSTLTEKIANEYLVGMSAAPHVIMEHGRKFQVDWEEGQKTGFFLDQRDNRKLLEVFSKGKNVLNTFCYTGGFSIYALHAGANKVHSVDASEKAIDFTRKNIELNGFNTVQHGCFVADTFDFFKESKEVYDVMILDPPAFAKHKDARHQAMKGYQRLNAEAMKRIAPDGILFTFSCSQVVDKQLFYDTVVSSAIQAGRDIRVLYRLSQPADHPVSIFHPEGEYLKGLVLQIR